jgi:hypothetical protein
MLRVGRSPATGLLAANRADGMMESREKEERGRVARTMKVGN